MTKRRPNERASSLMLVPAGVLVLIILASISADSALAFMAKRELQNQAAAAVNDAVTAGIAEADLQLGADARPNPELADRIVHDVLDGYSVAGMTVDPGDVVVTTDDDSVSVEVGAEVPYLFAGAIPGAADTVRVNVVASAELRAGA